MATRSSSSQFVTWSGAPTFSATAGTAQTFFLPKWIKNPGHKALTFNLKVGYTYPAGWSGNAAGSVFRTSSGTPTVRTPMQWVCNVQGGTSVTSQIGWIEALAAAPLQPSRPESVTATATGTTTVDVDWVAGSSGSTITQYKVYRSDVQAGPYLQIATVTAPTTIYENTGLTAGQTYWYTVAAFDGTNTSPQSLPDDATTFPGNPQPVVSIQAAATSSTEIRVDWIPSMDPPLATSYSVRAGLTVESPLPEVDEVTEPTRHYIHGGLSASTSYDFVVRAKVAGLESVNSARVTAVTPGAALPSTPADVVANALSSTSIIIEWVPGSGGAVATSYKLYHSLTQGGPYAVLVTLADADVNVDGRCTYTHTNLAAGSAHYYRVSGVDSNGEGQQSFEASATTTAAAPTAPTNVVATGINATTIRVTWIPGSGGSQIVFYRVFRGDSATSNFSSLGDTAESSFNDSTLTAGQTKFYRVRAFDAAGLSAVSVTVSGTTQAAEVPGPPINVNATMLNATTVRVKWTRGTGSDPTGYKVYRATASGGLFTNVGGTVAAPPLDDGGFAAGETRYYRVTALDSAQSYESDYSVTVPITNQSEAPDTTAPTAPSNLQAQVSGLNVTLSWTASTDPTVVGQVRSGIAGYNIYRGGVKVGETNGTGTTWSDPGPLTNNTQYSYKVKARDGATNLSNDSNTITPTTGSVVYGWNDGFQSGTAEPLWKVNTAGNGTVTVVDDPILGAPKKVVRCRLDRTVDGTEGTHYRAEALSDMGSTFPEWKKEVWYGWRTLFPAGWVSDPQWALVMQCHGRFVPGGSSLGPALGFYLNGTTLTATGRYATQIFNNADVTVFNNNIGTVGGSIATGAWTYFVMRVVWNWDNSGSVPGQCQIWVNGTSKMNYTGPLGYNTVTDTGQPVTPEWRFGLYMSKNSAAANIIRTIYNDSARIAHTYKGGSYAAVDPSGDTP